MGAAVAFGCRHSLTSHFQGNFWNLCMNEPISPRLRACSPFHFSSAPPSFSDASSTPTPRPRHPFGSSEPARKAASCIALSDWLSLFPRSCAFPCPPFTSHLSSTIALRHTTTDPVPLDPGQRRIATIQCRVVIDSFPLSYFVAVPVNKHVWCNPSVDRLEHLAQHCLDYGYERMSLLQRSTSRLPHSA